MGKALRGGKRAEKCSLERRHDPLPPGLYALDRGVILEQQLELPRRQILIPVQPPPGCWMGTYFLTLVDGAKNGPTVGDNRRLSSNFGFRI